MRVGWILALVACTGVACTGDGPEMEAATCDIALPESGTLRTDGSRIVDGNDRTVTLRGINTGGRSKFAPYSPFDYDEGAYAEALDVYLDRAQAWGFDVLRVPFSWAAAEPAPGEWDEEFLTRYDLLLDGAHERGMWTIVDFHQDIYAEGFCGDGFPHWTLPEDPGPPDHSCPDWFTGYVLDPDVKQAFDWFWDDTHGAQTAFKGMWDVMASRHAERPGVIGFEIINEPGWGNANPVDWSQEVLTPFYSEMTARIQAQDPDALVFFDSTGLNALQGSTSLLRPEGDNIVYAPHFYDASIFAESGDFETDVASGIRGLTDKGAEWDVPVLLGEFGVQSDRPGAEEYARNHYAVLDEDGHHGTWWEYSTSTEVWNAEELSVTEADGTPKSIIDAVVRPYVRALAGDELRLTWDDAGLRVEFDAVAGGVTEVVLPEWLFGANDVELGLENACYDREGDRLLLQSADGGPVVLTIPR